MKSAMKSFISNLTCFNDRNLTEIGSYSNGEIRLRFAFWVKVWEVQTKGAILFLFLYIVISVLI